MVTNNGRLVLSGEGETEMTLIDFLGWLNGSYLVALAVLVALVVEAIKQTEKIPVDCLSLVASLIGYGLGIVIGLLYQVPLLTASFNGLLVGLLAAGGYDVLTSLWHLTEVFK